MSYLRTNVLGSLLLVLAIGLSTAGGAAAEAVPFVAVPNPFPTASSVSASIDGGLVLGSDSDSSALSGAGITELASVDAPFGSAQITELQLLLDDGVEFSLRLGLTARAEPGATRVTLLEPGPAGAVVDGKFDQLDNLFAFEGEVWLSTQPNEPLDLSTVDPVTASLYGIELIDNGTQIDSLMNFDLQFVTSLSTEGLPFEVPLTIDIAGGVQAIGMKPLAGDWNGNGELDAEDIDLLSQAVREGNDDLRFDLNGDQLVDWDDHEFWVHESKWTYFGDADLDGQFNSADFVFVFTAGEYEDDLVENSGWATGDWDGNADFDTSDFVKAFVDGGYELGPRPHPFAVPEPSAAALCFVGADLPRAETSPPGVIVTLRIRQPLCRSKATS